MRPGSRSSIPSHCPEGKSCDACSIRFHRSGKRGEPMSISFDHLIITAKDREASARFFIELAEARPIPAREPFANVELDDGVMLQFAESHLAFLPQHYAFLVDDKHFDRIMERIGDRGLEHWADPLMTLPGQTNLEHGGRGVYVLDPAGHFVEFATRSCRREAVGPR